MLFLVSFASYNLLLDHSVSTMKILTGKPRTLEAARAFRDSLLNHQASGVPLRYWPVIIHAETEGYHVCETGFATRNGFEIVK